jgi:transcriptional regulator with XRE-family HTH domain
MNNTILVHVTECKYFLNDIDLCGLIAIVSNTADAVQELRAKLSFTQQELANRVGVTARAIANYEAGRTPRAEVLQSLALLAQRYKLESVAKKLRAALREVLDFMTKAEPINQEEAALTRMFLCLVRDKDKVPEWPQISQALLSALERLVERSEIDFTLSDTPDLSSTLVIARSFIATSTERKVQSLAAERAMRTGETTEKATNEVLLEHPELYAELAKERAAKKRGGAK